MAYDDETTEEETLDEARRQAREKAARETPHAQELQDIAPKSYFEQYDDPNLVAQDNVDLGLSPDFDNPGYKVGVPVQGPTQARPTQGVVRTDGGDLHTGQYVTQEDFRKGREEIEAYKRQRAENNRLRRAAAANEAQIRQNLLRNGYFDDGHGNLRQKKYNYSFAERRGNRDVSAYNQNRRTVSAGEIGNLAWQQALQQQQAAVPQSPIVQANREATAMRKADEQQANLNNAGIRSSVFEAFTAAYDNLKSKIGQSGEVSDIFEPTRFKAKDAQGRDARWTYDARGRVTGQNMNREREPTGQRFVTGFVDPRVINGLNDNAFQLGDKNRKIVGIMAQQPVDANGRATGKPMFYLQVQDAEGRRHGEWKTIEDVYRFGVKGYEDEGYKDAEDRVINSPLGDVMGTRKNRPISEKMLIEKMKIDADLKKTQMLEQGRDSRHVLGLVAAAQKARSGGMDEKTFVGRVLANPKSLAMLMRDESKPLYEDKDGNIVDDPFEEKDGTRVLRKGVSPSLDENGEQRYAQLSPEDAMKRALDIYNQAGRDVGSDGTQALWDAYYKLRPEQRPPSASGGAGIVGVPIAKLNGGDEQAVDALRQHGGPTVDAAAQMNGTGDNAGGRWNYNAYKWNPDNNQIDPGNIKGTGISFDQRDRAVLPPERRKEFEAWMDELASPKEEWELEDGRKVKVRSALVPKDWRTNKEFDRDYDFVRAFLEGASNPDFGAVAPVKHDDGYWLHINDIGKLPNHPTFSKGSYYAQNKKYAPLAGDWRGEEYLPGEAERKANDGQAPAQAAQPQMSAEERAEEAERIRARLAQRKGPDYAAEKARRRAIGEERNRSIAKRKAREAEDNKPLSQTRLADLPGKVWSKGARKLGEVAQKTGEYLGTIVDKGSEAIGRGVDAVANATPSDIGRAIASRSASNGGMNPAGAQAEQQRMDEVARQKAAEAADAEQSRRAAEYYSRKLESERSVAENSAFIDRMLAELNASMAESDRHKEIVANMDRRLAELESERKEKAKKLRARKAADAKAADLRRVRDLYSSGDIDAIRDEMANDEELASLLDEVLGGE